MLLGKLNSKTILEIGCYPSFKKTGELIFGTLFLYTVNAKEKIIVLSWLTFDRTKVYEVSHCTFIVTYVGLHT